MSSFDDSNLNAAKAVLDQLTMIKKFTGDASGLAKLDARLEFYVIKQEAHRKNYEFMTELMTRVELDTSMTDFPNLQRCKKLRDVIRIDCGWNQSRSLVDTLGRWKSALECRSQKIARLQKACDGLMTDRATFMAELESEYEVATRVYEAEKAKETIHKQELAQAERKRQEILRQDPRFGCDSCRFGWCVVHDGHRH